MNRCAWQTLKLFLQETVPVEDPVHVFCGAYAKVSLEEMESVFESFCSGEMKLSANKEKEVVPLYQPKT